MNASARPLRDVTVVCPTYQEGATIGTFLERMHAASNAFRSARLTELIFVDDGSTDGTVELLRETERTWTSPKVILVQRSRKDGTVSAQIAGFQRASTPIVVTMDVDGQHTAETIDRMARVWEPGVDLVVASRYVPGAEVHWEEARRGVISGGARALSQSVLPGARRLSDPLSGFFLAHRDWVTELPPASNGYKLLLYVLAMHPRAEIREVPYEMGMRIAGESKLVRGVGFIPSFLRELAQYRRAVLPPEARPLAPRSHCSRARSPPEGDDPIATGASGSPNPPEACGHPSIGFDAGGLSRSGCGSGAPARWRGPCRERTHPWGVLSCHGGPGAREPSHSRPGPGSQALPRLHVWWIQPRNST